MQLREVISILESVDPKALALEDIATEGYTFKGLHAYRHNLGLLGKIPQLHHLLKPLFESDIFASSADIFSVDRGSFLKARSDMLSAQIPFLLALLKASVPPEQPNTISVRIPDSIDLLSVIADLGKLEKALSQLVVNSEIDGQVRIATWYPGSLWVDLSLQTSAAMALVGGVMVIARLVLQERRTARGFDSYLKTLNDAALSSAHEDSRKRQELSLIDSESEHLERSTFPEAGERNERTERIKNSVKILVDLMERGAIVRPLLEHNPEMADQFPDPNPDAIIERTVRNLGNSATQNQ